MYFYFLLYSSLFNIEIIFLPVVNTEKKEDLVRFLEVAFNYHFLPCLNFALISETL